MAEFSKEPNTRSNQISAQEQYIALLEEQISKQRQAVQLFCDKLLVLSRDLRTQFSNFSEVTENNDSFTPPSSQAKKLKAEKTLAGKNPRAEKRVPSSKEVGTAGDKKLKAKKNVGIYDDFISDILKQHCPGIGITRKGMDFMNYLLDYYISEYGADNEKPTINDATAASSEGANPAA